MSGWIWDDSDSEALAKTYNAVLYSFSGAIIGTTEYSLTNNSTVIASRTDVGLYRVFLDMTAMISGDEFELAVWEKAISGGTQYRAILGNVVGLTPQIYITPSFFLGIGWDFTLKKITGTDQAFAWSVRSVGP